jgi:predicted MFS family arabinose efflux permease
LLFLGLFFWRETRAANPVLDLSLLRIPGVSLPTLGLILQMFSFAVAVSLVPFFLEGALRLSPAQAGAVFAVSAVGLFLGSFPGGILYDRFGVRRVAVVTLAAMALAFAGLTMLSETSGIVPVIVILGVIGLMEGAFQSSTSAALLGAVPTERLSTASALFVVGIMLPLSAGLILGGTLLTTRLAVHEAALGAGPAAVAAAYHEVALMGTAFALAALLVHLLFGRFVQRKRQE